MPLLRFDWRAEGQNATAHLADRGDQTGDGPYSITRIRGTRGCQKTGRPPESSGKGSPRNEDLANLGII